MNQFTRRSLLLGGSLAAAGIIGYPLARWLTKRKAPVFIARNQRYDGTLVRTIRDGLLATGLDSSTLAGRRVLLKPNLVEPTRDRPHMTTHPAMILAAAEVFRSWDAIVTVGEGPGHVRDTEYALSESGVAEALATEKLSFADLNYEDVAFVKNAGGVSGLDGFFFPRPVVEADLVVSMPKMKTHHWVGVTAAMKNMYGVIPGIKYGWPKNVLHQNGIPETVFDINASVSKTVAIIDAIDCMEGDGPIMGSLKPMGLVVIGTVLTAVDATVCRLMQIEPTEVSYLKLAANRLGPIDERSIEQRGEAWKPLTQSFEILDVPHLRNLRRQTSVMVT
jgi:uncharacterized protein (DUF362 family)